MELNLVLLIFEGWDNDYIIDIDYIVNVIESECNSLL